MQRLFIALLALIGLPAGAFGQLNASVGGTVSDATGALVPGVEISVTNVSTGIVTTTLTNEAGAYQFPNVQPGTYTLSANLPGFEAAGYENVRLSQNQPVRLNFTLQVAGVSQTVEVLSDAASVLATTSASVGDVLPDVSVRALPLATRNVLDLVSTAGGSVGQNFAGTLSSAVNTTRDGVVVSGGRFGNAVYAATYASPDLVEEVQVVLNNVDASSGWGANQVRLQTRSGGNQYHGALFYTNNNSALNAQGWFDNLVGAEKSYENRNQFGGRLGGPIIRNKAFFFFLYEGQRYLEKENFVATVLTEPARAGIFRYLTENAPGTGGGATRRNGNAFSFSPSVDLVGNVLTTDPLTGTPLFVNTINTFTDINDPNRQAIDPVWVARELLPRMPLPNDWTTGDGLNTAGYRWLRRWPGVDGGTGTSQNQNRDQYNIRLDYHFNANHKFYGTMSRERNWGMTTQAGVGAYPEGFNGEFRRWPDVYTAALTSTLSPSVLNEFRFGLRRFSFNGWAPIHKGCCRGDDNGHNINEAAQAAAATLPTYNGYLTHVSAGAAPLNIGTSYIPFTAGSTRGNTDPSYQFANTVSWVKGVHSFRAGVEVVFQDSDGWNTENQSVVPRITLGVGNIPVPGVTNVNFPGLNANDISATQNLLALLAGTVSNVQQNFIANDPRATAYVDVQDGLKRARNFHRNDWGLFFKDDWKVTNNFTLNYGVRYDAYGVPWEAKGLAARPRGGQAGMFGISGTDFSALWNPWATGGSLAGIELVGKNSPNPDLQVYDTDRNNFAPSLGFSWNLPRFGGNTVLRGGYGVNYIGQAQFFSYDSRIGGIPGGEQNVSFSPAAYTDLRNVSLPLAPVGAPFGEIPLTSRTQTFNGYIDNLVNPYVQSFNLSLQRELLRNLAIDVGYIGSKSTKLYSSNPLNTRNIFENGILEAFNVTRAGGNHSLFDQILLGRNVTGVGLVNGTTLTGSEAFRRFATTNQWIANGDVGSFANWLNSTSALTGQNGGLLRGAGLPENFIVVNPQFGNVDLQGNDDNSTYHALQTRFTKRMSHGFSGQLTYTWSKTLGNTSNDMRDPRNVQLQKGLLNFHRTHQARSYATWDLPFGPNRMLFNSAPGMIHRIVEGWQLSGMFSWTSGSPLGFNTSRNTNGGGSNTADIVGPLPNNFGKVNVQDGFVEYFQNLSVRAAPLPNFGGHQTLAGRFTGQVVVDSAGNIIAQDPAPGSTGSSALRFYESPSNLGLNVALGKRTLIGEGKTFTIRADAINFLNTPNWGNPNQNITSANFGRITSATGARTITIDARLDF